MEQFLIEVQDHALAQVLISVGVKYGQVCDKDMLPHPSTVSWKIADVAANVKQKMVMPEILICWNKWGGGITTDMWTESYRQVSYIIVMVHYITDEWKLVERVIASQEFDPDLRHSDVPALTLSYDSTLAHLLHCTYEISAVWCNFDLQLTHQLHYSWQPFLFLKNTLQIVSVASHWKVQ